LAKALVIQSFTRRRSQRCAHKGSPNFLRDLAVREAADDFGTTREHSKGFDFVIMFGAVAAEMNIDTAAA